MAGIEYRKIRHYTERIFSGVKKRPDFNQRAKSFRNVNAILSKQAVLNADLAVKAMPESENTDGKKRTLASAKTKLVNINGIVFDPKQKYEPGKIFKHYVTNEERFMVLSGLDTNKPNWGWIDDKTVPYGQYINKQLSGPRVSVSKYKRDMRTGRVIENTGVEIKSAPLGETIKDKNPGGSIMHHAARAGGLIVDALGKLRCPPGTPAANQFTDHMGSNCFGTLASDTEDLMREIAHFSERLALDGRTGLASRSGGNINGLNLPNPTAVMSVAPDDVIEAIRKQVPGWTPEFEKRVMDYVDFRSRVEKEAKAREQAVEHLATTLGITGLSTDRNGDIFSILDEMHARGLLGDFEPHGMLVHAKHGSEYDKLSDAEKLEQNAFHQILAQINTKFTDPNATTHDKLMGHEAFFVFSRFHEMKDKNGNPLHTEAEAIAKTRQYYADKANGKTSKEIKNIDGDIKAMWEDQRGYLSSFAQLHLEDPARAQNYTFRAVLYEDNTHAESIPLGGGHHLIRINPLDVLRNPPPPQLLPNEALIFSVPPGQPWTDQQKQEAVARAVAQHQFLTSMVTTYAADLPAAFGGGQSSHGAQVFWHEFAHTLQWDAIEQELRQSDKNLLAMSNEDMALYMSDLIVKDTSSVNIDKLTGHTTESLITSRLDALSGQYGQDRQQIVIAAIQKYGENSPQFQAMRRIAEMEITAELYSNRRNGIISGSDIDDALEWMDRQKARPIDWQAALPQQGGSLAPSIAQTLGLPTNPDGTPNVGNPRAGRTSTIARYIREGRLDEDEINNELWDIQGRPWGNTISGASGIRNKFVQDYLKANHPNTQILDLTDDEIVKLSKACQDEATRLRSLPVPSGPSIDKDSMNGYKEAQNGAKRLDSYSDDLQDIIDLRAELVRQTGPNGTPVVHVGPDGNPVKPRSEFAGKPGAAFKKFKSAFKRDQMDAETLYEMAHEYRTDLTDDEFNELIDMADWDPVKEAAKLDNDFWALDTDITPDDPMTGIDPKDDPFSPDYVAPEQTEPRVRGSGRNRRLVDKRNDGLASSARMHSVHAQRVLSPQELHAVRDTAESVAPFGGITDSDSSLESSILSSARKRRILTDAGINTQVNGLRSQGLPSSSRALADQHIESFVNPVLEAMDKTPSSRDMAIQLNESDFNGLKLDVNSEIQHRNFAVGISPENGTTRSTLNGSKVFIHIPKGSRVAVHGQGRGNNPKMIIPPGSIKITGKDADGNIYGRIIEQQSSSDILDSIKKRVYKASGKMKSDEKREAAKILDSIDKITARRNARGNVDSTDLVSRQVGDRNSNILLNLASHGASPFGLGFKNQIELERRPQIRVEENV